MDAPPKSPEDKPDSWPSDRTGIKGRTSRRKREPGGLGMFLSVWAARWSEGRRLACVKAMNKSVVSKSI